MPSLPDDASATDLTRALEAFLAEHPPAVVVDDGRVWFDMGSAKYALSAEYGRCVLHHRPEERNLVRTVVAVDPKPEALRLQVKRFGRAKLQFLQLLPDRDQRAPTTRSASRAKYQRALKRVRERSFPEFEVAGSRNRGPGSARHWQR